MNWIVVLTQAGFSDEHIGPFDTKRDAEYWVDAHYDDNYDEDCHYFIHRLTKPR